MLKAGSMKRLKAGSIKTADLENNGHNPTLGS